jgi:hypothetical protein
MRNTRRPLSISLALLLAATPALAQQPLQDSARRAASAAGAATAQPQASPGHGAKFLTGAVVASAGGAAIVLGMTAFKTADSTSGNTPEGVYDACVAQAANPVYRNNDCGVLKGPNTGLVVAGAAAAAAGVTLMLLGRSNNSIDLGPGGFAIRRKLTF